MGPSHKPQDCTRTVGPTRRVWLSSALILGVLPRHSSATATLPRAKSLRDELALALKKGHPLMVLVSLDRCPFCKLVRENYLGPLRREQGLLVVQVDMRSSIELRDFKDAVRTHNALVHQWHITTAPVVLFFGRGGLEVAPRLEGVSSLDYYGAFLDQRLEQARAAIKAP